MNTVVVICGNVLISFLIAWLLSRPSVALASKGPVAVWSPEILTSLTVEILGSLVALAAALLIIVRKKDFL